MRVWVTSAVSNSLWLYWLKPTRLLCPWDSPSKNIGVGSHFLLQGIFLIQGWKPCLLYLLHWKQILYHWATGESRLTATLAINPPLHLSLQNCFEANHRHNISRANVWLLIFVSERKKFLLKNPVIVLCSYIRKSSHALHHQIFSQCFLIHF